MSKLLIVESPAKAKTIAKYLGSGYSVKASMGHLRDLPKKELGVDVEHDFEAKYIPIDGKDKVINELKSSANKAEMIYLATDPDREGEAISWHLYELLELEKDKTKRVSFNEITQKAVNEAMASPRDIDMDLVNAQQARRILDRIVGYKLSPFLWRKMRSGLSAGRVQSVVTRLVVDREREIKAFVPQEYWTIDVLLNSYEKDFTAHFYGDRKGRVELPDQQHTDKVLADIDGGVYTVLDVKKAQKKRQPAPPFITSTLQQDASRKLSMTAKRTMAVAQELYEGVDVKGMGAMGLITYMRTDSLRVSAEAQEQARQYIEGRYGAKSRPQKPRVFRSRKGAQDAHEAIRPSDPSLAPDMIKSSLTPDQFRLYRLIWSRFIASQMSDAIFEATTVEIENNNWIFRATGQTPVFQGFLAVYEESRDDESDEDSAPIPPVKAGDTPEHKKTEPKQHFTAPPPRYTEAALIREMEERGIGRPSTYAPMISVVQDRDYVAKEGRTLRPTTLGEAVTDLMLDKFQDIIDIKFTATMENRLDDIEQGQVDYRKVLEGFYQNFSGELAQAERDLERKRIKIKDEESDVVCEHCGRKMVIKTGRFGKFLACPGYPECKNTKPLSEDLGIACPVCGAKLLKKKSKSGYYYYGCEKNPNCPFMTWDKPINKKCPQCGGVVFKRYTRQEKKNLCHKPGCGYEEPLVTRAKKGAAEEGVPAAKKPAAKTTAKAAGKTTAKAPEKTASKTAGKAASSTGKTTKVAGTAKTVAKTAAATDSAPDPEKRKPGRPKKVNDE